MREIKFRTFWKGAMSRPWSLYEVLQEDFNEWSDPQADDPKEIIMQYTGLKDKNGKEIYEGDILFRQTYDPDGEQEIRIIKYHPVGFGEDWRLCLINPQTKEPDDNFYGGVFWLDQREIIGNIYENPELLNDK